MSLSHRTVNVLLGGKNLLLLYLVIIAILIYVAR